ncbi:unnamed protein product [Prunus armeniaca]|uniref:Uncharacterized protein n=1 Tax=Prunus armeniaca TaxID=36596 RepID=A0A6J5UQ67_PRUAR|nr:unnamed protein product [Prunus armeniaca]
MGEKRQRVEDGDVGGYVEEKEGERDRREGGDVGGCQTEGVVAKVISVAQSPLPY